MPNTTTLSIAPARYPRLRVGLVENTTSLSPVLRTALAMMDVTGAKIYGDNEGVLAALRQGEELDVLFLNWCGSHNDPVELASTIRGTRRHPDAFLAMAVLLSNVTREKVLTARDAGIDEFLAVPFTPAALAGRLKSIVHDRRGFVDTPTYFGPDRRRGAMANFLGCSRTGESVLIDPADGRQYISREDGSRHYAVERSGEITFL